MTKAELTAIIASVKSYIASLPERIGPAGERGEKGESGKDGRDGMNGKDGAAGERGMDGTNGKDGESIRGEKGEQGERGERGIQGERGLDGAIGFPGPPGTPGIGVAGKDGRDGKDAELPDIAGMIERAMQASTDRYALDFERRMQSEYRANIEKMPKPKDGKDGLAFTDISFEQDEEGDLILRLSNGDIVKEGKARLYVPWYRGVFKEGELYRRNHSVTFGGSQWIALKDEPTGKPGTSDDWQLSTKKGRDGRDGVKPPPTGPVKL